MKKAIIISLLAAAAVSFSAKAQISIPNFISDNMVVQQKRTFVIPGKTAVPGATVTATASWDGRPVSVEADSDGSFRLELKTPAAGGPYTITISDGESTLELGNVLSGEVWVCSGQSNMEMPVKGWGKVLNYEQELAEANYPDIRLLQIRKDYAFAPVDEPKLNLPWCECSGDNVENFSAAAYFFAREIHKTLGIPVAVIDCSWGGTAIEPWTPARELATVAGYEYMNDYLVDGELDNEKFTDYVGHRFDHIRKVESNLDPAKYHDAWTTEKMPKAFSKMGLETFDGTIWYQCRFRLPADCAGKPCTLSLGIIDSMDETYINGTLVGSVNNYEKARLYSVEAGVTRESNVISIKIMDNSGEGGFLGTAEQMYIEVNGKKFSLACDWAYAIDLDFNQAAKDGISVNPQGTPTCLYNGMLHPLHILPIRGFLWYQGCANVGRDEQYADNFPKMVNAWRRVWGGEKKPFYFVQLASYLTPVEVQPDSKWAALRKAQTSVLALDNTGMAVATDIGDATDIHPKNKQEVGHRLALLALKGTYGKKLIAAAPAPVKAKLRCGKVIIRFNGKVRLENDMCFVVGTEAGEYLAAKPVAKGRRIILDTRDIADVTEVMYNWADCPQGLLRCAKSDLPVAPFRIKL